MDTIGIATASAAAAAFGVVLILRRGARVLLVRKTEPKPHWPIVRPPSLERESEPERMVVVGLELPFGQLFYLGAQLLVVWAMFQGLAMMADALFGTSFGY